MSRQLFVIASLLFLSQPAFAQTALTTESDVVVTRGIGLMPGMPFAETVMNAPVSARTTNRMVRELCDGNRIVHEHVTEIYRDASGRVRREHRPGGSNGRSMIMITDPVGQTSWMLEETTKTAYKSPMFNRRVDAIQGGSGYMMAQPLNEPSASVGAIGPAPFNVTASSAPTFVWNERVVMGAGDVPMPGPATVESLGPDTIDGVRVEGTAYTTTYPANLFGNELPIVVQKTTWYAPELQMMLYSEEKDPRMGTVTITTEIASLDEPDPALFEVPDDYQIIEPARAHTILPVE